MLTTHFHALLRLRKSGDTYPLLLYAQGHNLSQWTARVVFGSQQKCGSRTQEFLCDRIGVKRRGPQKKRASHDLPIVTGQGELRLEKRTGVT